MLKFLHWMRANFCVCFLALISLACAPCAFGQDFSLQASPPNPSVIDPHGVDSVATITLGSLNGFSSPVTLFCAITPVEATNPPTCQVSPATVTPPASPSLTFSTSTTGLTPATQYTVTVTGVSGSLTHTVMLNPITVISVAPQYTLAVGTAITPTSVHAGSGATAVVNISSSNGYTGNVTPACIAITPTVEPSPICTFVPATVAITNGAVTPTTLTINTTGPTTTTARNAYPRAFYALFLPLPFAVIAGLSGAEKRRRKLVSLFCLCMMAGSLLALPACNASKSVNNGSVTPNNTYTFTITAYDANGVAATNTSVTVSLTVN